MLKNSDKEKIIAWFQKNKTRISMLGISTEAGISNTQLHKAVNGRTDSHGTLVTIPEKHVPALKKIIEDMKF